MKITEVVRGAWRRVAGVSSAASPQGIEKRRRTAALPSIFNSYGPLNDAMPKPTPYNLRRFSETPIARRAINCIKDRIAGMRWRVQPRQGYSIEAIPDGAARVRILTDNFDAPNPDDSFRSLAEQVLEDIIVGGYGAIEVQLSPGWNEGKNPHFSQRTREMGHPAGEVRSPDSRGRLSPHATLDASLRLAGRTNASAPTQAPSCRWCCGRWMGRRYG